MVRARIRTGLVLAGLLGLLWLATAAAENADATTDKYPLSARYGQEGFGLPPEYSINDVVFPASYPDPASLSEGERAMISTGASGYDSSWAEYVYELAAMYYNNTGKLPATIDLDLLKAIYAEPDKVTAEDLEKYRCPLTGEIPRLDAKEFSPGNLYLQPISEEEQRYIADLDYSFNLWWFEHKYYVPGVANPPLASIKGTPPVYYRVYGEHAVLEAGIAFSWTFEDESVIDAIPAAEASPEQ